jgi:hypothetical protein
MSKYPENLTAAGLSQNLQTVAGDLVTGGGAMAAERMVEHSGSLGIFCNELLPVEPNVRLTAEGSRPHFSTGTSALSTFLATYDGNQLYVGRY